MKEERFYRELIKEVKEIKTIFLNSWEILNTFTKDPLRQMQERDAGEFEKEIEETNKTKKIFLEVERKRAELEEERNKLEEDRIALQKIELDIEGLKLEEELERKELGIERKTLEKEKLEFQEVRDNLNRFKRKRKKK